MVEWQQRASYHQGNYSTNNLVIFQSPEISNLGI